MSLSENRLKKTKILQIVLPPPNPWKPAIAEKLMISIFSVFEPISLIIQATSQAISWQIEVSRKQQDTLKQLIFGIYPFASITVATKTSTAVGMRKFNFQTGNPFIYPIMFATELPELDPLATLTSSFGNLQDGEVVIYELRLRTARGKYEELGLKLIEEELPNKDNKQRLAENKVRGLLKEVDFSVKIKTKNQRRAFDLVGMIFPTLAVFDSKGFNYLVRAQKEAYNPVFSAQEVAALWHLPTEQCQNPRIKWARGASAPSPQYTESNKQQIILGVNDFQGNSQVARLAYRDRVSHINILGGTGVGKSTLMHQMIHQDILNGKSVGVIDPHGWLVQNILRSSIPKEREKDVVLLDVHDSEFPVGLNILKAPPNVPMPEVASQAVSVIRKIFADYWSPTRMETALYAALTTLMTVEDSTIMDVPRLFHDSDFRSQFYDENIDPMALQYWLYQYEPTSKTQKQNIADPILHRLSKFYSNLTLRNMVCQTTSLDFAKLLDQKTIFLANLGDMPDIEAETLGALLISKLQIAAMSRSELDEKERGSFYLYIDEVQNFSTTSLPVLFSGARKYGLSLAVANQYLHQLEGETLEAVLGNVGTSIIFRVGPRDATVVAPYVKPHFANSDLESMGRFRAIVKMQERAEAVPAFNIQTYAPLQPHEDAAERIERIKSHSRAHFARKREDVEREINKRMLANRKVDSEDNEDEEDSYLG